jgi:Ca-activated chloride channel homolog
MSSSSSDLPVAVHDSRQWRGRFAPGSWAARAMWTGVAIAAAGSIFVGGLLLTGGKKPTGCGAQTTLTVAASPAHTTVLDTLARRWTADTGASGGRCVSVTVVPKKPSQVAAALSADWDRAREGTPPDVWLPDSSLWLTVAASRPEAARVLPPRQPTSIASSPVVLALRQPVAVALGWPKRALGSQDVLGAIATPGTFAKLGHPEWSTLRVGMSDPGASTPGLASVLAALDPEAKGTVTDAQLIASIRFSQTLAAGAPDTDTFFTAQRSTDAKSSAADVAAFPALERDVAAYNAGKPPMLLTPVYSQGAVVADYPYAVLNASWVNAARRAAADKFLRNLLGPGAQALLAGQGFRAPDRTIRDTALLQANNGFQATIGPPRPIPNAAALNKIVGAWVSMQRPANVLALLDTSGSMNAPTPGTPLTRLQLLQQTAVTGFGLLTNQTSVGLWEFSAQKDNLANAYRQVIPYGPVSARIGSVPRQQALIASVSGLRASGYTPLYDTIYAGFHELQNRWQPNSTNVLLVITDGKNELPPGHDGMALDQLIDRLKREQRADKPTSIICMAVGPDADAAALQKISEVTHGRTFVARDPAKAIQALILAFAGRLG